MEAEAWTMILTRVTFTAHLPRRRQPPLGFDSKNETFPQSISGPRVDKTVPAVLAFIGLCSALALGNAVFECDFMSLYVNSEKSDTEI